MTQPREITVKIQNRLLIMFNLSQHICKAYNYSSLIAAGTQARYFKLVKSSDSAPSE